jgi:putative transposase
MSQSLVSIYVHLVFSTKNREQSIVPAYEKELHGYIGGICNQLDCQPITIGGAADHIHILCKLSKKITLIKLVEEIKSHSSKWMKTKDKSLSNFYWQNGYGAFSVNPSETSTVIAYINNQHEHHSKLTFQAEYKSLLNKYNVPYDERYLWD